VALTVPRLHPAPGHWPAGEVQFPAQAAVAHHTAGGQKVPAGHCVGRPLTQKLPGRQGLAEGLVVPVGVGRAGERVVVGLALGQALALALPEGEAGPVALGEAEGCEEAESEGEPEAVAVADQRAVREVVEVLLAGPLKVGVGAAEGEGGDVPLGAVGEALAPCEARCVTVYSVAVPTDTTLALAWGLALSLGEGVCETLALALGAALAEGAEEAVAEGRGERDWEGEAVEEGLCEARRALSAARGVVQPLGDREALGLWLEVVLRLALPLWEGREGVGCAEGLRLALACGDRLREAVGEVEALASWLQEGLGVAVSLREGEAEGQAEWEGEWEGEAVLGEAVLLREARLVALCSTAGAQAHGRRHRSARASRHRMEGRARNNTLVARLQRPEGETKGGTQRRGAPLKKSKAHGAARCNHHGCKQAGTQVAKGCCHAVGSSGWAHTFSASASGKFINAARRSRTRCPGCTPGPCSSSVPWPGPSPLLLLRAGRARQQPPPLLLPGGAFAWAPA
jgi:hypothetical protein